MYSQSPVARSTISNFKRSAVDQQAGSSTGGPAGGAADGAAVVIGGSLAGLLAARVLSDHFAAVTILERDVVADSPDVRRSQPHARHVHGLLASGLQVLAHYFPGILEDLQQHGATIADMGEAMRWYSYGGYRVQTPTGLAGALLSRPLLEWQIRRRVLALPNVRMIDQCEVEQPVFDAGSERVIGVQAALYAPRGGSHFYRADLVIDAGGRNAATPRWLQEAGYDHPAESAVRSNLGYATRYYHRRPGDLPQGALLMVSAEGPHATRSALVSPIEGDRWLVTLGGINGDYPPPDEEGFLAFARSLPTPDVYNLLRKLQPISPVIAHTFPSSLRRHYEGLERFPEGWLVLGDALCSFNPVYGQGMSCAALEAQALDELLTRRGADDRAELAQEFFAEAAGIVDNPWRMVVEADFRFPATIGERAVTVDFINSYVARVHRATHHDPVVLKEFLSVISLMQPPASLFHPRVLMRVLRPGRKVA